MAKPRMPEQNSRDEIVKSLVTAVNSQGFLFQDLVFHEARTGFEDQQHRLRWVLESREYPVIASDGQNTKIDLVLSHKDHRGFFLTVECKRSHPNYSAWVFFGNQPLVRNSKFDFFYFEQIKQQSERIWNHMLRREFKALDFPLFSYYLESRLIASNNKPSSSDTIEKAFSQVVRGQSGLVARVLQRPTSNVLTFVPVVVTSARLFRMDYDSSNIALEAGTLSPADTTVEEIPWCGVSYHTSSDLKIKSDHVVGNPSVSDSLLEQDIKSLFSRTIFVVNAVNFREFLFVLGQDTDPFV